MSPMAEQDENCQKHREMSVMEGASQGGHHFTPDPNLAATLIQAKYRGYRTRKSLAAAVQRQHAAASNAAVAAASPHGGHHFTGDPDSAATLIQAQYRGYRTRKSLGVRLSHAGEENQTAAAAAAEAPKKMSPDDMTAAEARSQLRMQGLKDISNRGKDHQPSEEELNRAATKIQASFRGYHVRRELQHRHEAEPAHLSSSEQQVVSPEPDEAAKKIQAAYRGYRVRKQYRSMTSPITSVSFFDPDDAKYAAAATKIQASYRGYRIRKTNNFHRSSAASASAAK